MKMLIWKKLLVVLLAFIAVFLDVSFFSFWPIFGATLISSFVLVVIFSLLFDIQLFLIFSLSVVFFFAIFSSLPLLIIIACFLLLPALLLYVRDRYLPEPNFIIIVVYLIIANSLFEIMLLTFFGEWNENGLLAFAYFITLNTLLGLICLALSKVKRKAPYKIKF